MSPANRSKNCAGFKPSLSWWYWRQTFFLRMSLFKARKYFRAKISTLKNSESNFSSWQNRPELHGRFSTIRSTGKVKLWIMLIVWWWDTSSMSYQPNGDVNRCKWTAQFRRLSMVPFSLLTIVSALFTKCMPVSTTAVNTTNWFRNFELFWICVITFDNWVKTGVATPTCNV